MKQAIQKDAKALLEATGYDLYTDDAVLATIPRSEIKEKVEVFKLDRYMTNAEVLAEYEKRGLHPATLDEILSVEKNYDYIVTLWGEYSYVAFNRWDGRRDVRVSRRDEWGGGWWFAGVGKSSTLEPSALPSDTQNLEFIELRSRVEELEEWRLAMKRVFEI